MTLPRQIKKGGAEVLDTVPLSETTQYAVEFVNKPTFLKTNGDPEYRSRGLQYLLDDPTVGVQGALCYSLGVIDLPEIPNAMCEDSVIVWEAYRVETELITLPVLGSGGYVSATKTIASVEGPQMYFWAVGGSPLDVVGFNPDPDGTYTFAAELAAPKGTISVAGPGATKSQVTTPKYTVEGWAADPSMNDNTKYFGRIIGGSQTPPVITYGNGSTTPLVDEYGVGPLCLHGVCYLTSVDLMGTVGWPGQATLPDGGVKKRALQTAAGRFFRVHFRQRRVKNPWTMEQMLSQFLRPKAPVVTGAQTEVSEVTMTQDKGPSSIPPTLEPSVGYGQAIFNVVDGQLVYPDGQGGSINIGTRTQM